MTYRLDSPNISFFRSPPRRRAPPREPSPERPKSRRPRGYRLRRSPSPEVSASPARYTPQPPQEHEPQPAPKPEPTGQHLQASASLHNIEESASLLDSAGGPVFPTCGGVTGCVLSTVKTTCRARPKSIWSMVCQAYARSCWTWLHAALPAHYTAMLTKRADSIASLCCHAITATMSCVHAHAVRAWQHHTCPLSYPVARTCTALTSIPKANKTRPCSLKWVSMHHSWQNLTPRV